jgi:hypothetical protein
MPADEVNPGWQAGARVDIDAEGIAEPTPTASQPQGESTLVRLTVRNLYNPDPQDYLPPDVWRVELDGEVLLARTRLPFLDGARALLARGVDPEVLIVLRHRGAGHDSFRPIRLGVAARLTVEEGNRSTRFRPYREKPGHTVSDRAVLGAFSGCPATTLAADEDRRARGDFQ